MTKRRVVVTGIGCVTPIGIGKEEFWNSLIAGKNGIGLITRFDTENFPVKIAGEVKDWDYTQYIDKKEGKRMDRVTQFGVTAAKLALEDSKLNMAEEDSFRAGVCVSSGIGGMDTFVEQTAKYLEKGPSKVSPLFIPMEIPNMTAGQIAIALGLNGPNTCIVTACASGTNSIGDALRTIQYGDADIMLAGGAEAAVNPLGIAGFANMKALSRNNEHPEEASRPFDKNRAGFVMGEGAGVIVLEELEHAKKRGAHIYCELVGFAMNCDAHHITAPDPTGMVPAKCFEQALKDAGVQPEEVDYINAHGTSTHLNDLGETKAYKAVFGEHAYKLCISSIKSMVGHLLGAAGGVEAIATALTIENDIIPPTMNYQEVDHDEECDMDLDYVPNKARERVVNVAMSDNLGFGGHNAVIVMKKYVG